MLNILNSPSSNLVRHPRQPHDLHARDVSGVRALVRELVEAPVHHGKSTPLYHRCIGILIKWKRFDHKILSFYENISIHTCTCNIYFECENDLLYTCSEWVNLPTRRTKYAGGKSFLRSPFAFVEVALLCSDSK